MDQSALIAFISSQFSLDLENYDVFSAIIFFQKELAAQRLTVSPENISYIISCLSFYSGRNLFKKFFPSPINLMATLLSEYIDLKLVSNTLILDQDIKKFELALGSNNVIYFVDIVMQSSVLSSDKKDYKKSLEYFCKYIFRNVKIFYKSISGMIRIMLFSKWLIHQCSDINSISLTELTFNIFHTRVAKKYFKWLKLHDFCQKEIVYPNDLLQFYQEKNLKEFIRMLDLLERSEKVSFTKEFDPIKLIEYRDKNSSLPTPELNTGVAAHNELISLKAEALVIPIEDSENSAFLAAYSPTLDRDQLTLSTQNSELKIMKEPSRSYLIESKKLNEDNDKNSSSPSARLNLELLYSEHETIPISIHVSENSDLVTVYNFASAIDQLSFSTQNSEVQIAEQQSTRPFSVESESDSNLSMTDLLARKFQEIANPRLIQVEDDSFIDLSSDTIQSNNEEIDLTNDIFEPEIGLQSETVKVQTSQSNVDSYVINGLEKSLQLRVESKINSSFNTKLQEPIDNSISNFNKSSNNSENSESRNDVQDLPKSQIFTSSKPSPNRNVAELDVLYPLSISRLQKTKENLIEDHTLIESSQPDSSNSSFPSPKKSNHFSETKSFTRSASNSINMDAKLQSLKEFLPLNKTIMDVKAFPLQLSQKQEITSKVVGAVTVEESVQTNLCNNKYLSNSSQPSPIKEKKLIISRPLTRSSSNSSNPICKIEQTFSQQIEFEKTNTSIDDENSSTAQRLILDQRSIIHNQSEELPKNQLNMDSLLMLPQHNKSAHNSTESNLSASIIRMELKSPTRSQRAFKRPIHSPNNNESITKKRSTPQRKPLHQLNERETYDEPLSSKPLISLHPDDIFDNLSNELKSPKTFQPSTPSHSYSTRSKVRHSIDTVVDSPRSIRNRSSSSKVKSDL